MLQECFGLSAHNIEVRTFHVISHASVFNLKTKRVLKVLF